MDGLPLHPALVHLPLGLAVAMPLLLLAVLALGWKGGLERRMLLPAVLLQVVMVAGALLAQRTGEQDEEAVEEVVAERLIHEHEERAEMFTVVAGVGALVLAGALLLPAAPRRWVVVAATGLSLGTAGLGIATGHAGDELVYVHDAPSALARTGWTGDGGARGLFTPVDEDEDEGEEDDD